MKKTKKNVSLSENVAMFSNTDYSDLTDFSVESTCLRHVMVPFIDKPHTVSVGLLRVGLSEPIYKSCFTELLSQKTRSFSVVIAKNI